MITLHFFHTNDLHSHFDHWASLISYLNYERARLDREKQPYLTLDLGDHMDRAFPITEGLLGAGNVQLLNAAKYDYVTIGNNEGITFTKEQIGAAYEQRKFKIILANLYDKAGERPKWCLPEIVHTMNGVKVGLIGLTAAFPKFYQLLGWDIRDPFQELKQLVNGLRQKVDVLVLLSHVGLPFDERIARELAGIDVIIGAHTHHTLRQGKWVDQTLIAQAGKFGKYVGHITVDFDEKTHQIVHKGADLITLREPADPAAEQQLKELIEEGLSRMQKPLTRLSHPLPVHWFRDSEIVQILADALREWCQADIGLVNAGAILDGLPAGIITSYMIHRICPHPINPCKVEISGSDLIEMINIGLHRKFQTYELKGFGFRGKVLGKLAFSHVTYQTLVRKGVPYAGGVAVDGKPVRDNERFSVGTIDMFTLGDFLPPVVRARQQFYLPETLRDLLAWQLQKIAGNYVNSQPINN